MAETNMAMKNTVATATADVSSYKKGYAENLTLAPNKVTSSAAAAAAGATVPVTPTPTTSESISYISSKRSKAIVHKSASKNKKKPQQRTASGKAKGAITTKVSSKKKLKRPSILVTGATVRNGNLTKRAKNDNDDGVTVGYHDELDKTVTGKRRTNSCIIRSSHANTICNNSKNNKKLILPPKPTLLFSSAVDPIRKPPLMSRYCGKCGDLLSRKVYGYDELNRNRRMIFHPNNDSAQRRNAISAAVKRIVTPITIEEKELFLRGLPQWPEESMKMDETIIEGLLRLKHTPKDEALCRCWTEPDISLDLKPDLAMAIPLKKTKSKTIGTAAAAVNMTKKISTKQFTPSNSTGSTAKKVKVIKKKKATKLPFSNRNIKTVVIKCPKTGKKIKKTYRIVKKLVKTKQNPHKTHASGVGNTTAAVATKLTKKRMPSDKSTDIRSTKTTITSQQLTCKPDCDSPDGIVTSGRVDNDDVDDTYSEENDDDDESAQRYHNGILLKNDQRNDEKVDLKLREKLMNCPLKYGPMFPSKQELLELTTIRKQNALQTFYKRLNELRQFIVIFGDANVPQQFPENHSLGIWVNKMRMERKKWDTGSERTSLTEHKIEMLESIDFIWAQNHKGEIGWERRFQEIQKFKRKHGHCNVPTKSAENRALGRWVSTQRTMYKNYMKGFVGKSLTKEEQERRIFLLLKEGFLFSMIPNGHDEDMADDVVSDSIMKTPTKDASTILTKDENRKEDLEVSVSEKQKNSKRASSTITSSGTLLTVAMTSLEERDVCVELKEANIVTNNDCNNTVDDNSTSSEDMQNKVDKTEKESKSISTSNHKKESDSGDSNSTTPIHVVQEKYLIKDPDARKANVKITNDSYNTSLAFSPVIETAKTETKIVHDTEETSIKLSKTKSEEFITAVTTATKKKLAKKEPPKGRKKKIEVKRKLLTKDREDKAATKKEVAIKLDDASSPTRRSGRTRKPSARQLESRQQDSFCESISR